jgi:hypothetical protein
MNFGDRHVVVTGGAIPIVVLYVRPAWGRGWLNSGNRSARVVRPFATVRRVITRPVIDLIKRAVAAPAANKRRRSDHVQNDKDRTCCGNSRNHCLFGSYRRGVTARERLKLSVAPFHG